MKNRHDVEYHFEEIEPGVYTLRGHLQHWRFSGHQDDLAWAEPNGGPRIALGGEIEGRPIQHISARTIWITPFQKTHELRIRTGDRPQNPDVLQ